MSRYIFVTPYYKEDEKLLNRCLDSVRAQTIRCDHILIADGFPQKWVDNTGVRHISLDQSHGDFGNTARGLGALLCVAEEYDGIGLLDADNWLENNHLEICLDAANRVEGGAENCDLVFAQRHFRRLDGTIMPLNDEAGGHVDTNCFFFLRGSYSFLPQWCLIPKRVSYAGDRFFYQSITKQKLRVAKTTVRTVNYHTTHPSPYLDLGETPPNGTKTIGSLDFSSLKLARNIREAVVLNRLIGSEFFQPPASRPGTDVSTATSASALSRNSLCSCGSGKKYKHCHGRLS